MGPTQNPELLPTLSPPTSPNDGLDADDRLMSRYASGDAAAFERLYERYEGRVYGFCLKQLGDPASAADAFQDTFRRLVETREDYEPRGKFSSWLFTLARRSFAGRWIAGRADAA